MRKRRCWLQSCLGALSFEAGSLERARRWSPLVFMALSLLLLVCVCVCLSRFFWGLWGFKRAIVCVRCSCVISLEMRARSWLEEAVTTYPDSWEACFRLGACYWEMGGALQSDKSKCQRMLLLAAKLNPNHGETFAYLGSWFEEVASDQARAKRCFLKGSCCFP